MVEEKQRLLLLSAVYLPTAAAPDTSPLSSPPPTPSNKGDVNEG
jgi:hypothetical protein